MTNKRRRLVGEVVSAKMQKTVKVRVDRSFRHPIYGKVVRTRKFYLAHDELGCEPGDKVQMVESRPLSRRKRWAVETILRRASQAQVEAEKRGAVEEPELEGEE
jgi:small subunit ribosomal protein S17